MDCEIDIYSFFGVERGGLEEIWNVTVWVESKWERILK